MSKKILVAVLCANLEKYLKMSTAIKNTWGLKDNIPDNMTVKYYYGKKFQDQTECIIDGDDIYTPNDEVVASFTPKMYDAFEVLANEDFDYIFRCCDGSYVDLINLNKWIDSFPEHTNIYRGVNGFDCGCSFVSGAGFLLSRDVFEKMISNRDIVNNSNIDDVELGIVMNRLGVPISSYNVHRYDVDYNYQLSSIDDNVMANTYHYHFRNYPEYMYSIYEKIKEYRS